MKKTFLTFIALMMVAVQGFAGPADSLATIFSDFSGQDLVGKPDCLTYVDGEDPSAVNPNGGPIIRILAVTPPSLSFPSQTVGKEVRKTFYLTGSNLYGFVNVRVSGSGMFTTNKKSIQASLVNGRTAAVTVSYTPTRAGSHTATVIISGGGIQGGSLTVKLSGTAVVRSITPGSTTLTFSNVPVGSSVKKTIRVTGKNLTKPISVNWAETTSGEFTVSPRTLPASGGTLTVTYTPSKAGSSSARISLSSGDVSNSVHASGTAPTPSVTVSKSSLYFSGAGNQSFTVTSKNFYGKLTLKKYGSNIFGLSTTSINVSNSGQTNVVTVSCNPTSATLRGVGFVEIIFNGKVLGKVSYSYAKNQPVQISSVESDEDLDVVIEEVAEQTAMEAPANSTTEVDELAMNSKVYSDGQNIVIESAVDQSAIISDIAGHARRVNLTAGSNVIPVNGNGIHIVKVGDKTTKLMIK